MDKLSELSTFPKNHVTFDWIKGSRIPFIIWFGHHSITLTVPLIYKDNKITFILSYICLEFTHLLFLMLYILSQI